MKEILILRHGETEQNVRGIVQGSGIDSSLNENGHRQAQLLYDYYKDHSFDLIIASNLKRTEQTIKHFLKKHIEFLKDERIREISWGEHEGKAGEPELMAKYYRVIQSWQAGNLLDRPEGGESALELQHRLHSFIEELNQKKFKKALICTHGRTLRAFICLLKGWPLSRMEEVGHANTGLYHGIFSNPGWIIHKENDLEHLHRHTLKS